MADQPEQIWRLTLIVIGPAYRETIELYDDDPFNLEPELKHVGHAPFERYRGEIEGAYLEIRRDHVVSRRLECIDKPVEPVHETEQELLEEPLEARLTRGDT